ncbi:MAG: HD domain-containing protein [Bacillaceae bacterium]|nr:HD domain-containing protein [Bacillaceae bacterium]
MRYTVIDQVTSGQNLGKSIYTSEGKVLLRQGAALTDRIIHKLKDMGISAIYIEDERFSDVEVEDIVSDETKRDTLSVLNQSIQCVQANKDLDMESVNKTANQIIQELLANKHAILNLTDIRTRNNDLFIHSLNVTIMSLLMAVNLGYNNEEMLKLAIGAMFHDVGKVVTTDMLDKVTLKKYADELEEHTWRGYHYLRKKPEIGAVSAHIALQHHEYLDGSGTPRGLTESDIHPNAKIVAITNYYDNLVSQVGEGKGMLPHEACEEVMGLANIRFDHDLVWQFLRTIAAYPNGITVRLSSNEYAIVVRQNKGLPQRPVVRIFEMVNNDFSKVNVREIDLAKETTLFIEEVLEK